jgi:hypothetical protein
VASIAHEREHEGERAVMLSHIKGPERGCVANFLVTGAVSVTPRPFLEGSNVQGPLVRPVGDPVVRALVPGLQFEPA